MSFKYPHPFTVLRAIACLAIIIGHTAPPVYNLFGKNLSRFIIPSGLPAISVFFIVSGFFIGKNFFISRYPLTITGIIKFYVQRFIRIIPSYYIVIFITGNILFPGYFQKNPDILYKLLTFQASDFQYMKLFAPLWAISTEMQFYIIAPAATFLLYHVGQKIPLLIRISCIFIIIYLYKYWAIQTFAHRSLQLHLTHIYTSIWGNADLFMTGMLLPVIVDSLQFSVKKLSVYKKLLQLSGILLLTCMWITSNSVTQNFFQNYMSWRDEATILSPILMSIGVGVFIVIFELFPLRSVISFTPSPLEIMRTSYHPYHLISSIGTLSYGLFLWNRVIIDYFHIKTLNQDMFLANSLFVLGITGIVAMINYTCIEFPFLSIKKLLRKYITNR